MSTVAKRGRRYSASLMAEARQMASADGGGWNAAEITRILNRRGLPVTYQTVLRWVSPKYDERQRRHQQRNRARHRAGRLGSASASEATKVDRVIALRALKLPWEKVADLVELDFEERIDPERLRRAVLAGRWPATVAAPVEEAAAA